jgi:hypothetical protein
MEGTRLAWETDEKCLSSGSAVECARGSMDEQGHMLASLAPKAAPRLPGGRR